MAEPDVPFQPTTTEVHSSPPVKSAAERRGIHLASAPPEVKAVLNRIIFLEDELRACRGGTPVGPTPQHEKGMFRKRGPALLDQCIYLLEQMHMESLNGVLCQVDDEDPRACKACKKLWAELDALVGRYDAGER